MGIRARVGRHTQLGGRHCQNWSDDQQKIVDLLNKIPAADGGTGALKPRIVAGICSDDLYGAIVTFENKYFPGQRSGFVDPGGKMYQKLEALAAPPAKPSPPPPAPPPPAPLPMQRSLTSGEEALLRSVFQNTIPYWSQVMMNEGDIGGEDNSITPGPTPMFSRNIWCADFSDAKASDDDRSTFIHEFTHVWQFYHGITKLSVIWLAIRHPTNYQNAYPYDLSDSNDLTDFNVEQQASIIEDWWRVSKSLMPLNNQGGDRSAAAYAPYIDQIRNAGPPHKPVIPPIPRFRR